MLRSPLPIPRLGRRSTLSHSSQLEPVSPPSLRHAPASPWQRILFWLMAPSPQDAAPPLNRLPGVREAFVDVLADIGGDEAVRLRWRIQRANSLRELWHLRADTFRVVGLAHSQSEAERRVAQLARHFPRRASRSQFVPQ